MILVITEAPTVVFKEEASTQPWLAWPSARRLLFAPVDRGWQLLGSIAGLPTSPKGP